MKTEAIGEAAKEMFKRLEVEFPLEVQVLAIYDALEGRPETLNRILMFRQSLANQFNLTGLVRVTGNLTVNHPDGPCRGTGCGYEYCRNSKG